MLRITCSDSTARIPTITSVPITGLVGAETIEGIDVRPVNGDLYALGVTNITGADEGRIYRINPDSGVATQIGTSPFSTALVDGARYGLDFNPVVDRIRIVSDEDQNFRVNPNTGALAGSDNQLTASASIAGSAYDRNAANSTVTTLFGIDAGDNTLVRQGGVDGAPSPNGGAITTIGPLGFDTSGNLGFDIENVSGTAFAALTVSGVAGLYTIDLGTGAATFVGALAPARLSGDSPWRRSPPSPR